MNVLLSTTYFGPVQWYQKLYRANQAWIEGQESFQKQTYRNRCLIATTQGVQALIVPVEGSRMSQPSTISNLRISDHGNWRHLHWNALQSAYGESPFFEYYEDDLRPFFQTAWEYLVDFNEAIRQKMCELIDIQPRVAYTTHYEKAPSALLDLRDAIQPKRPADDTDFSPRSYYQVYSGKHGFLPNLSILDLLLNMGPESIFYL